MSTRTVTDSVANVTKTPKSALFTIAELVNDLVAEGNELRTDHETTRLLEAELIAGHATFVSVVTDLKTAANLVKTYLANGVLQHGTLAANTTSPAFKTTTAPIFTLSGFPYTTAVATCTFTTANTINSGATLGSVWGSWLVQIATTGTITTKGAAADMSYGTEASAITALPALTTAMTQLGYITINTTASVAFTAGTTQTNVTSCKAINFYDLPGAKVAPSTITTSAPATLTATAPATLAATAVDDIAFRGLGAP